MSDRTCQLCGGPVSPRNTSGFCHKTPECKKQAQAVADARWYAVHPDVAAARNKAWLDSNKERRVEYMRQWYQDPETRERRQTATQGFRANPANAERIREYSRRGRIRYMARADRKCGLCDDFAEVGSKFCLEHRKSENRRQYRKRRSGLLQRLVKHQDWICPWCTKTLPEDLAQIHIDHIIPRASGLIIDEEWNYQALHHECNLAKFDKITPQAIALAAEHGLTLAV